MSQDLYSIWTCVNFWSRFQENHRYHEDHQVVLDQEIADSIAKGLEGTWPQPVEGARNALAEVLRQECAARRVVKIAVGQIGLVLLPALRRGAVRKARPTGLHKRVRDGTHGVHSGCCSVGRKNTR